MFGRKFLRAVRGALSLLPLALACGNGDDGSPTNTGQACARVEQCYPGLDRAALSGAAVCLDRVTDGYCTHHCAADEDCCKLSGECPDDHAEVCSPFESTGEMYCFLSCEDADLEKASIEDGETFCKNFAGSGFGCRSTGGGANNRKVCLPN